MLPGTESRICWPADVVPNDRKFVFITISLGKMLKFEDIHVSDEVVELYVPGERLIPVTLTPLDDSAASSDPNSSPRLCIR